MRSYTAEKSGMLVEYLRERDVELTLSALRRALAARDVKVNGARVNADVPVHAGDCICVYLPECAFVAPYSVLYEDGDVLVVDKKKGVTSEGLEGAAARACGARLAHRLDRNTAGVLVLSKNERAHAVLLSAFRARRAEKIYLAEVNGRMEADEGVYEDYLSKDSAAGRVKVFSSPRAGAAAIRTGWKVLERRQNTTLVEVRLYTGRTHQIRAHFAFHGHFVAGDGKYGDDRVNRALGAKGQRLLSYRLTLRLPEGELPAVSGRTFESGRREEIFGKEGA